MKKKLFLSLFLTVAISITSLFAAQFPSAIDTYAELNQAEPFVLSCGISISQTGDHDNTANPLFLKKRLQELMAQEIVLGKDPRTFLRHKDHIGYVLRALQPVTCQKCHKSIDSIKLNTTTDKELISKLLDEAVQSKLTLKTCPYCTGQLIEQPRPNIKFTPAHRQAMMAQINHLGVKSQAACTKHKLPTYRISLELTDALSPNSLNFDAEKLDEQAQFITALDNPLLFFHHYTNPTKAPFMFENEEDEQLLVTFCEEMIKRCPQITHVCPISQPLGFFSRVTRGSLPPFECSSKNIDQNKYLQNIIHAQVAAGKAMKAINPNIKILVSHQWKPMHPLHGMLSPWYALESMCSWMANYLYNGRFVRMMQPHQDTFDGIALSIYPALTFDKITPVGENTAATFSADDALEAIMSMHKAFPTKDIYIVETGCNSDDAQTKKDFIDMTLHVCKIARSKGVKIPVVYLWGQTNDEDYYMEWNKLPGSTYFGPFDKLNPTNPCDSINAAGRYVKEILSNH